VSRCQRLRLLVLGHTRLFLGHQLGLRTCAAHCALAVLAELSGVPTVSSRGKSCSAAGRARAGWHPCETYVAERPGRRCLCDCLLAAAWVLTISATGQDLVVSLVGCARSTATTYAVTVTMPRGELARRWARCACKCSCMLELSALRAGPMMWQSSSAVLHLCHCGLAVRICPEQARLRREAAGRGRQGLVLQLCFGADPRWCGDGAWMSGIEGIGCTHVCKH